MGILLNGRFKILSIPEDKRLRAINMLLYFKDKKKATVHQLQKLAGYLNFLNKAIVPGRVFTRRMYAKFSLLMDKNYLKPHHHVRLDSEFKGDCHMWLEFLNQIETRVVCRPMVDLSDTKVTEEIQFYSDASGSRKVGGFGVYYNKNWIAGVWEENFIAEKSPSIEYLELAGLCMGVFAWCDKLQNTRVSIFCDNISVRDMVNSTSSSCRNCMVLLRLLVLKCLRWNIRLFVVHVSTKLNGVTDSLSRQQWDIL